MSIARKAASVILLAIGASLAVRTPLAAEVVTVKGVVLLPDGKPAAGARVVTTYMAPLTGNDLQETTADAAGKFTLTVDGQPGGAMAALLPGHPLALAAAKPGEDITLRFGDQSAALTGTVVDQQDKPVAGAQVGLVSVYLLAPVRPGLTLVRHNTEYLLQTTTGADGRFSIPDLPPDASVQYVAQAPGLAQSADSAQLGQGDARISLGPEATIIGRVTRDGQPAPGILVHCSGRFSNQFGLVVAAVTAADGTYRLEHLGAGRASLSLSQVPEGYAAPLLPMLTLQTGDHLTGQDFVLTPGALLTGKVTAAGTGAPVAGASVSCYVGGGGLSGGYSAQTDATGVHHLRVAPGQGQIVAQGAPPDRRYWTGSPDRVSVTVAEGDTREGLDFTLNPPPTVNGTVLCPDGQPAVGARVFLAGGGGRGGPNQTDLKTDAAGKFALEVPGFSPRPGVPYDPTVTVAATLAGCALGWASGKLNEEMTVHLGDKPVAFSGTVTDAQDKPVAGAQIGVQTMITGDPRNSLYLVGAFPPVTTGLDGQFSFPGFPAGVQVIYGVTAPGWAPTRGQGATGTPDLKVALAPEATVAGKVTAGGQPVAGVGIRCWNQTQNGWATTGAGGTYHIGGLSAGTFTLTAQGRDFQNSFPAGYVLPAPVQVTLQTGDHLTGQDLALVQCAQVSGKVTAGGKPVAGVQVMASGQDRNNDQAVTAADGTYHLDHLSAGTFTLVVWGQGPLPEGYAAPAPVPITIQAGDKLTGQALALVQGALLTGKVTEAGTGKALAGEYVNANPVARGGGPAAGAYPSSGVETDATGVFRLWVAPGKWQLNAQAGQPEHRNWRATQSPPVVEVAAGDQKEGLDFVFSPLPHAKGKVLLADGTSAAGVLVGLVRDLYERQTGSWEQRFPNKTGPDGSFDLELGEEYTPGQRQQTAVLAMQPDQGLVGLAVVADPAPLLEIRLAPGAYVTAQVSDSHDQPLAAVRVYGWWYWGQGPGPSLALPEAVSDAQGHLKLGPLPAGTVNLYVSGTDGAYMLDPAWPRANNDGQRVQIDAGVPHELPPLRLDRAGRTVSGSVLDADGRPVEGAVVIAELGNHPTARSDAHGLFTITGLAMRGPVRLAAVHPTQPLYNALSVDPDQGNGAHFTLQALGSMKGQIVDADGKPVAVNQAQLINESGWWYPGLVALLRQAVGHPAATPPGDSASRIQPDAQGHWHVDGLIAGLSYTLRVWGQAAGNGGQVMAQYPNLQVKPGETTDTGPLALKPQANGWPGTVAGPKPAPAGPTPPPVMGRVLRPDGQPAAGALNGVGQPYDMQGGWEARLRWKVNVDGRFGVDFIVRNGVRPAVPTPQTPITLIAVLPDAGLIGWAQVTDATQLVTLNLVPGAFATVHVTDLQGRPVAGVLFESSWCAPGQTVMNDFNQSFSVPDFASDAQGNVKIGPLPTGTLAVRVKLGSADEAYVIPGSWNLNIWRQLEVALNQGETQALPALQIDRAGRAAYGSVVDAAGNPVANALVIADQGSNPTARTDAQGKFTIAGLAVHGPIWLVAAHPTQPLYAGYCLMLAGGGQAHLVLQPLGNLSGRVMNDQHQPVPNSGVTVQMGAVAEDRPW
jgi:hypothetical protein